MKIYHPYYQAHVKTGNEYHYLLLNSIGGKYKPPFDTRIDYNKISKEYEVFIGDRRECIVVLINRCNDEKVAVLERFSYSPLCYVDKDLKKELRTKKMMYETFKFIKNRFGIKKVIMIDKSYMVCSLLKKMDYDKNRMKDYSVMNLYKLYVFTHGKPYYVYKFGFKYMNEKPIKYNKINREIIKNINIDNNFINKLKQTFEIEEIDDEKQKWFLSKLMKSQDIRDFIKKYNKKIECEMFFIFLERLFGYYDIKDITGESYYLDI